MLTIDRLKELLEYNEHSGVFRWKLDRGNKKAGTIAGTPTDEGYIQIGIDGCIYKAHRLAWFYVKGYLPTVMIDHEDRIKDHNWFLNLREASNNCNQVNVGLRKNNKSGFAGVRFFQNKWMASIKINRKQIYLGSYASIEEAFAVRWQISKDLHGKFMPKWA